MLARFEASLAILEAPSIGAEALCTQARAMWPGEPLVDLAPFITVAPPEDAGGGMGFMLTAAGQRHTVMIVPRPLPALVFTPRPDALDAPPLRMPGHGARVTVTTSSALRTQPEIVKAATAVSVLAAALTTLLPTVAVGWSTGGTVTSPDIFRTSVMALACRRVPVAEWIGLGWSAPIPSLDGPPAHGMVTTGLNPFIGREIELAPSPLPRAILAERVAAACAALILSATAAQTQHSLGEAHAERITLRPRSAGTREGTPVFEMRVDPPWAISEPVLPRFGRRRVD